MDDTKNIVNSQLYMNSIAMTFLFLRVYMKYF